MRSGQIDLAGLELPVVLRSSARVSDDELMSFSAQNKPFKVERNKEGELTMMTPVDGIGSTHEQYITGTLFAWTGQDGRGIDFSPSAGFNLPDSSCLQPDASWMTLERWSQDGYMAGQWGKARVAG